MRYLFFINFLYLFLTTTTAQIDTIWLNDIHDDNRVITQQLEWFKDVEQVLDWSYFINFDTHFGQHHPIEKDTAVMPLNQLLWFRGCICNTTDAALDRWVYWNKSKRTEMWTLDEQGSESYGLTGRYVNKNKLDMPEYGNNIGCSIPAGKCTNIVGKWVYSDTRILKKEFDHFYVVLRSREQMENQTLHEKYDKYLGRHVWTLIFMTVLGFLAVFMLLQYFQSKDSAYGYYAAYIASLFVYYLLARSHIFHFPFRYIAEWSPLIEPYLALLPLLLYIYFFRSFLFIKPTTYPQIYKITQWAEYMIFGMWLLFPFVYIFLSLERAMEVFVLWTFFFIIPASYSIILVFKQKKRLARYFILGTAVFAISGLYTIIGDVGEAFIQNYYGKTVELHPPYLIGSQYGIMLESIIFAVALGYRSSLVQQQKETFERQLEITKDRLSRAQLSPHFIFNALNAIKYLLETGKHKLGIKYLVQFAGLLRQILGNLKKSVSSLDEELVFCRQYLSLEQLRFPDDFEYEIKVDKSIDVSQVFLPSILLQPLLENAIQHGLLPLEDREGYLKMEFHPFENGKGIAICIEDNGIGREAARLNKENTDHNAVGLELTRQRIEQMYAQSDLKIRDLYDTNGKPIGTSVDILIPYKR